MAARVLSQSGLYRIQNVSKSFHGLNSQYGRKCYHQNGILLHSNRRIRQARPKFREEYNDPFAPPSWKGIIFGGLFFTIILLFGSGIVTPSDFHQWEPIGRDKKPRKRQN